MAVSLPDRAPSAAPSSVPAHEEPAVSTRGASQAVAKTPFAELVHTLGHEAERGEATVRSVMRGAVGRDLSSLDLLALQAGIYRYGETIDLAAKLVDKAGTDVRTVLQGSQ
jgi:hypothetical protein